MALFGSPILTLYYLSETRTTHSYGLQMLAEQKAKTAEGLSFLCNLPCDSIAIDPDGSGTYKSLPVTPELFWFEMVIEAIGQPLPPITIKGSGLTGVTPSVDASIDFSQEDSPLLPVTAVPPYNKAYTISSDLGQHYTSCMIWPNGKNKEPFSEIPLGPGFKIVFQSTAG